MAYAVTCDDVRNRLRTILEEECSDEILESPSFIPACQAIVEKMLSEKGISIDSLPDSEKPLAKAAIIALTAARVVASAPTRETDTSVVRIRPVMSQEKETIVKLLLDEAWESLGMLGISKYNAYFGCVGFDDCLPENDSLALNLNSDFSLWAW